MRLNSHISSVKNTYCYDFDGKLLRPTKRLLRCAAPRNDGGELVQSEIAFLNPADFAEEQTECPAQEGR